MAYHIDQSNGDLVIDGFDQGIAPSPHKGIANLQAVNISTESGEVMCSFDRIQQAQVAGVTGTLTQINTSTVSFSLTGGLLLPGSWFQILVDSGTGLSGNYYYLGNGKISTVYSRNVASAVTGITSGTATISVYSMGKPIQSASETYGTDANGSVAYRYYILDSTGLIWVHDTNSASWTGIPVPAWFLPDISTLNNNISAIDVFNGWLVVTVVNTIAWKTTAILGSSFVGYGGNGSLSTSGMHTMFAGRQGKLYVTDGNFLASIFPDTSLLTGAANIQSYCQYTAMTTTLTVSVLIGGAFPLFSLISTTRIPIIFFTDGTLPAAISVNTVYYIQTTGTPFVHTFNVYTAPSGGSPLDMQTGSSGNQYFNTFYPVDVSGSVTITFTPQRLNLPFFEFAQSMAEIGNLLLIGTKLNTIYPWNQIDPTPLDGIPLAENNAVKIITVNNMGYIFAGQKGNIYICNGSTATLAVSVPDYCAGIAGTPQTYVEPFFTWGDAMYMRGRVWFSIQDQTSTKIGNCGGIWSFVPAQNFFIGQDTGLSLRLENQSSYGTYNGASSVLIPAFQQLFIGPQYYSGWYSDIISPTYGIDFSDTIPGTTALVESDLIPTGTFLIKKTFTQIEYKLAAPLASGETVSLSFRQNGTDSYTSITPIIVESTTGISGYAKVNFQKGQWLQIQASLNPVNSSSSSFVRLKEIRIR